MPAASANQIAPSASSVQPSGHFSSSAQSRRSRGSPSGRDVERGCRAPHALPDDQRATVGGDHRAVGELEAVGRNVDRAVGLHAARAPPAAKWEFPEGEAEVAHVRGAIGGDDHVVAPTVGDRRQVGVLHDRTVGSSAEHRVTPHRHHQQATVGQPTEAARKVVELDSTVRTPSVTDARDGVLMEIREPEPAVVPAWSLPESDTAHEHRKPGHPASLRLYSHPMRAAVLNEDHELEVRDVADPTPGPGELVLEVTACGICGSDLKMRPSMPAGHGDGPRVLRRDRGDRS